MQLMSQSSECEKTHFGARLIKVQHLTQPTRLKSRHLRSLTQPQRYICMYLFICIYIYVSICIVRHTCDRVWAPRSALDHLWKLGQTKWMLYGEIWFHAAARIKQIANPSRNNSHIVRCCGQWLTLGSSSDLWSVKRSNYENLLQVPGVKKKNTKKVKKKNEIRDHNKTLPISSIMVLWSSQREFADGI